MNEFASGRDRAFNRRRVSGARSPSSVLSGNNGAAVPMPPKIIVVRHGQAEHNVAADARGEIAYEDPQYRDARLTHTGALRYRGVQAPMIIKCCMLLQHYVSRVFGFDRWPPGIHTRHDQERSRRSPRAERLLRIFQRRHARFGVLL